MDDMVSASDAGACGLADGPAGQGDVYTPVEGGICAPRGISACGVASGLRKEKGRLDMALITSLGTCTAAGVFTRNVFAAAPVKVSRSHLGGGHARAIIMNSGNANAATGEPGMKVAEQSARVVADALGCEPEEVLVASTGVIGVPLDIDTFIAAVPKAVAALSATGGGDAARAIMTTDTVPKECAVSFQLHGKTCRVGGMCKGAGMISPDMATMLAVITTDVPLAPDAAHEALSAAASVSFNRVTVDSDTSTNDSCFMLATGAVDIPVVGLDSDDYPIVAGAVASVCTSLAMKIAEDGEGSTRLIEVDVTGAASRDDAELCARAIANSPLVKTAVAGHDANWGRIAAAAGRSGATFKAEDVDIDIMGIPVCRAGLTVPFDEDEALRRFEKPRIEIRIDLGAGDSAARIWTCDLTHGYISINADYRS